MSVPVVRLVRDLVDGGGQPAPIFARFPSVSAENIDDLKLAADPQEVLDICEVMSHWLQLIKSSALGSLREGDLPSESHREGDCLEKRDERHAPGEQPKAHKQDYALPGCLDAINGGDDVEHVVRLDMPHKLPQDPNTPLASEDGQGFRLTVGWQHQRYLVVDVSTLYRSGDTADPPPVEQEGHHSHQRFRSMRDGRRSVRGTRLERKATATLTAAATAMTEALVGIVNPYGEDLVCLNSTPHTSRMEAHRSAERSSNILPVLSELAHIREKCNIDEGRPLTILTDLSVCFKKTCRLLALTLGSSTLLVVTAIMLFLFLTSVVEATGSTAHDAAAYDRAIYLLLIAQSVTSILGQIIPRYSMAIRYIDGTYDRVIVAARMLLAPTLGVITLAIMWAWKVKMAKSGRAFSISCLLTWLLLAEAWVQWNILDCLSKDVVLQVSITASRLDRGMTQEQAQHRRPLWRMVLRSMVPTVAILGCSCAYILALFWLNSLVQSVWWRCILYFGCLLVKVAGNKLVLKLVATNRAVECDMVESTSFFYENQTCLLCRLQLLSIGNANIIGQVSLFSLVIEILVRVWFTQAWVSKSQALANDVASLRALWRLGRARSIDNLVDVQVEYTSPLVSAAMVYCLQPSGIFNFGTGGNTADLSVLLRVLAVQLIPELIVDFILCMSEYRNGLEALYDAYMGQPWRLQLQNLVVKTLSNLGIVCTIALLLVDIK